MAYGDWTDGGEQESSREYDAASHLERTTQVAHDDWADGGEQESSREYDAASHLERTTQVAHDDWVDGGEQESSREYDAEVTSSARRMWRRTAGQRTRRQRSARAPRCRLGLRRMRMTSRLALCP